MGNAVIRFLHHHFVSCSHLNTVFAPGGFEHWLCLERHLDASVRLVFTVTPRAAEGSRMDSPVTGDSEKNRRCSEAAAANTARHCSRQVSS